MARVENEAARMLKLKRTLVKNLEKDKLGVMADARLKCERIDKRIWTAMVLIRALEKGARLPK